MPRPRKAAIKLQTNDGNNLPKAPPGLPYGQRQAALQAQAAIPIAGPSGPGPTPSPGGPAPQPDQSALLAAAQQYQPPAGNLTAPTNAPGEPVTAGLASGPGAGPGVLPNGPDIVGAQLRALYQLNPSPDILRLIELHDRGT